MICLQEAHRVTGDLDGVFDNPTDVFRLFATKGSALHHT
jgi:hypothetical protein